MKDVFNSLKTTYIDKGIPVYIGEMGCVSRTTDRAASFRKYYLEYICKAAEIVEVMKKAIFTEDASYTLQSVYDNAPQ